MAKLDGGIHRFLNSVHRNDDIIFSLDFDAYLTYFDFNGDDNRFTRSYYSDREFYSYLNQQSNTFSLIGFNEVAGPVYSVENVAADWNSPTSILGPDQDRTFIYASSNTADAALAVFYPQDAFSSQDSGAQWKFEFDKSYSHLKLSYKVKFSPEFDFSRGGKLPGFYGGDGNSGGDKPNVDGTDGFSARVMWRRRSIGDEIVQGAAEQYVYHPSQIDQFGDSFYWLKPNQDAVIFSPDKWYTISTEIKMNSAESSDGHLISYVDGKKVLHIDDFFFGDPNSFGIDGLYFSTFFGGSDPSWSPSKDQYALFNDFIVTSTV